MSDVSNVLQSSFQHAPAMTSALCDYGDGAMGSGIRKLAEEMLTIGGQRGYTIGYDSGFSDGHSVGFYDGFSLGENKGLVKGTIITTVAIGTISLTVRGIKAVYNRYKLNQQEAQEKHEETEVTEYGKTSDCDKLGSCGS